MSYELKDMDLNPGDVVKLVVAEDPEAPDRLGREYTVSHDGSRAIHADGGTVLLKPYLPSGWRFTIVSRATPVEEVEDDGFITLWCSGRHPDPKLGDTITIAVTPYVTARGECVGIETRVFTVRTPDGETHRGKLLTT